MAIVQGITLISLAVDGDINVLCGVLGGAENGDKRVGGGVERRADWANRCESNRFPPPPKILHHHILPSLTGENNPLIGLSLENNHHGTTINHHH